MPTIWGYIVCQWRLLFTTVIAAGYRIFGSCISIRAFTGLVQNNQQAFSNTFFTFLAYMALFWVPLGVNYLYFKTFIYFQAFTRATMDVKRALASIKSYRH